MSKIVQRIKAFADAENISVSSIESAIGASNGTINKAIKSNKDISAGWLEKIIYAYPDINTEWLLTGNGEIKKSQIEADVKLKNLEAEVITLLRENRVLRIQVEEKGFAQIKVSDVELPTIIPLPRPNVTYSQEVAEEEKKIEKTKK